MNKTETTKTTIKEWVSFISFTVVILAIGFTGGFSIGRKYPSSSAMNQRLFDIKAEVKNLKRAYDANLEQLELGIELRDSIIYALKRELAKGDDVEIPVKVNINISNDDSE